MALTHDTTYDGAGQIGRREHLLDLISYRDQRKFMLVPTLARESAHNTFVEWQTDTYAAGATTNAVIEGAAITFATAAARTRTGNYTQLMDKQVSISSTVRATLIAGIDDEFAEQLRKRTVEIAKDAETTVLRSTSASGTTAAARTMVGMGAAVTTNTSQATANRDWTRTLHNPYVQTLWENGADPDLILCKAAVAFDFADFPADAAAGALRVNVTPDGRLPDVVRIFEDQLGVRRIVPSIFVSTATATATVGAYFLDTSEMRIAELISLHFEPAAKVGHSTDGFLEWEWTLVYGSQGKHGTVQGLSNS